MWTIGIIVFCNVRKEDMPLYHIFKLFILLFGFIMMFDTGMFLLSFNTDYKTPTLFTAASRPRRDTSCPKS